MPLLKKRASFFFPLILGFHAGESSWKATALRNASLYDFIINCMYLRSFAWHVMACNKKRFLAQLLVLQYIFKLLCIADLHLLVVYDARSLFYPLDIEINFNESL